MGIVAGLIVVFVLGLLMHAYVVQRLFAFAERLLYRMPFIKSVYGAIRDFFNYFAPSIKKEYKQVVAVTIGDTDMQVIGFVTQAIPEHLPEGFNEPNSILVYLPLSYMIGGYAVLIPRSKVRPLDMSMEDAMRFTLTGQNLFVITNFTGFDPEVNVDKNLDGVPSYGIEYTPYPSPRTFTFGLNVSF